ncbi:MAG TPA: hypothetical protein VEV39_06485, partial [Gemmatimonadales bacterium]|nr:hypothetical protein [Gemmatimonadales bacterium]
GIPPERVAPPGSRDTGTNGVDGIAPERVGPPGSRDTGTSGVDGIAPERIGPPGSRDTGTNGVSARVAPEFATTTPWSSPRSGVNAITGAAAGTPAASPTDSATTFGPCSIERLADTSAGRRDAARSGAGPRGDGLA